MYYSTESYSSFFKAFLGGSMSKSNAGKIVSVSFGRWVFLSDVVEDLPFRLRNVALKQVRCRKQKSQGWGRALKWLLRLEETSMKELPNIGGKTLETAKEVLARYKLKFGMSQKQIQLVVAGDTVSY